VGGGRQAILLGCMGLVPAAISAQAETVKGSPPPVLAATSATASVITSDGEGVNLGNKGFPFDQGSDLPVTAFFIMNEQAGITLPGGQVVTGFENAQAHSMIYDTMFFGNNEGEYDFLLNATANNDNPYGLTLGSASASATLTFQVELNLVTPTGDAGTAPVSLIAPVTLLANISGTGEDDFEISATYPLGDPPVAETLFDTGLVQGNGLSQTINEGFVMAVGEVYTVTTQADVLVEGNGTANLLIDPILEIDSSSHLPRIMSCSSARVSFPLPCLNRRPQLSWARRSRQCYGGIGAASAPFASNRMAEWLGV
jgi:hypothetical protein